MAETPVLNNLTNLQNETTAVSLINANNSAITAAFSDVLSRSTSAGSGTNTMTSTLDMNSQRIVNLAAPTANSDAARLQDVLNNATVTTLAAGVLQGGALNALPVFAGATSITSNTGSGTNAQILVGQTGAAPAWKTMSGPISSTAGGLMSINASSVTNAMLVNMTASSIKANVTNASAVPTDASITQVLDLCGGLPAKGSIPLRDTSTWTTLGLGSSGQVFGNNGTTAGWSSPAGGTGTTLIAVQKFSASGTYTPAANCKFSIVEVIGAGGGGGSFSSASTASYGNGGGGGGGGYSRKVIQTPGTSGITIGAAGTAGTAGGGNGGNGGSSAYGLVCIANGGSGGLGVTTFTTFPGNPGGSTASAGDVCLAGANGGPPVYSTAAGGAIPNTGYGGPAPLSGAGPVAATGGSYGSANLPGGDGTNFPGAGGAASFGFSGNTGGSKAGGVGGPGLIIVTEFS